MEPPELAVDAKNADDAEALDGANVSSTGHRGTASFGILGGIAKADDGEQLTAGSVFALIGGVRGVIESTLPAAVFLLANVLKQPLIVSVLAALCAGVLSLILRLVQRQALLPAISGLLGVGICVVIAIVTGRPIDYFLSGFITNTVWATALLISALVRWPLIGLAYGLMVGQPAAWRTDQTRRKAFTLITLLFALIFSLRLLVQIPFFVAEELETLGVLRLVMGLPLFGLGIALSWVIYHRTTREPAGGLG